MEVEKNTLLSKWEAVPRQDWLPLCLFCKTSAVSIMLHPTLPTASALLAVGRRCSSSNDPKKKMTKKWRRKRNPPKMTKDGNKIRRTKKRRASAKRTNVFDPWKHSSRTWPGNPLPGAGFLPGKKSWATSDGEVLRAWSWSKTPSSSARKF